MRKSHRHLLLTIGALVLVSVMTSAPAAVVNFHGVNSLDHGTGFGNVTDLLVVHRTGLPHDGMEFGSVLWNGSSVATTDDATNQSDAPTVADLTAVGASATNFAVVFNLAQEGGDPALDLHNFTIRFQKADGSTLFDAVFNHTDAANSSTLGLDGDGQGVGQGGYVFPVTFTPAQATLFFGDATNRVGMIITSDQAISNEANGGPESFFVGKSVVPEPAGMGIMGASVVMLLMRRRRA